MAKKPQPKNRCAESDHWVAQIAELNQDAVTLDGYDTCIVGIAERFGMSPVLAYDYDWCIAVLMDRDGMSREEAIEFFEFNTLGGWFGDGTPVFVTLKLP